MNSALKLHHGSKNPVYRIAIRKSYFEKKLRNIITYNQVWRGQVSNLDTAIAVVNNVTNVPKTKTIMKSSTYQQLCRSKFDLEQVKMSVPALMTEAFRQHTNYHTRLLVISSAILLVLTLIHCNLLFVHTDCSTDIFDSLYLAE